MLPIFAMHAVLSRDRAEDSTASTACVSVFALQCCIVGALHSANPPSEAKVWASALVEWYQPA